MQQTKITKKVLKETFNNISNKSDRNFKYKRCIKNSELVVMFQAYHKENTVCNNFYGIKLLDYNKKTEVATWYCNAQDIRNIIKYNLNN